MNAFLDLAAGWGPSVALVMGGAIAGGLLALATARPRREAWAGNAMERPTLRAIDGRSFGGSVMVGAGWGPRGVCPRSGLTPAGNFVTAMLAGMALHDRRLAAR